jgi:hypothetical protein
MSRNVDDMGKSKKAVTSGERCPKVCPRKVCSEFVHVVGNKMQIILTLMETQKVRSAEMEKAVSDLLVEGQRLGVFGQFDQ